MSSVNLVRLREALSEFDYAFLVSADADRRPHAVMVNPIFDGAVFDVGAVGDRTAQNITDGTTVTLLWPPRVPSGYALMVDGRATLDADSTARVEPTKALLHRRAAAGSAAAESGCLHDCVVFKA